MRKTIRREMTSKHWEALAYLIEAKRAGRSTEFSETVFELMGRLK